MTSAEQTQLQLQTGEKLMQQLHKRALVSFAQQTTAHGLMRLTQGSEMRRLVWGLVFVGACVGFSLHLSQLAQRYLSCPVSTEFFNDEDKFLFPTVTICPTNFITHDSPAIKSNFTIEGYPRTLRRMIFDIPRVYYQLLQTDWNVSKPTDKSVPAEAYNFYQDGKLALRAQAYRQILFQQPHETVIYCRYNSERCSFSNFTLYKDENRFLCMSFNPTNRKLVRSGEGNGLYLMLFNYGDSFLTKEEEIDDVPGFRIALHENGFKPDLHCGFTAPFGYKTSAELIVQTHKKVNRAAAPCGEVLPNATYTVDFSRAPNYENETFFGETKDCIVRILHQDFIRECGCLATHLAIPSDLMSDMEICHALLEELFFFDIYYRLNQYNLTEYTITNRSGVNITLTSYLQSKSKIYGQIAQLLSCYRNVRQRQETQGVPTKQCPVRCSYTRYSVATSLVTWPRDASKASAAVKKYTSETLIAISKMNLSENRIRLLQANSSDMIANRYISVLDLYARSTSATVSMESLAYPLRNLFSDLGGILGLWVGVSVITLLELVELILELGYLSALRLQSFCSKSST